MDIHCLDGLREVLSGIWDEPEGQAGKWASWLQDPGGTGAPGCGQSLGMWVGCYLRAPSMPLTRVRSGGRPGSVEEEVLMSSLSDGQKLDKQMGGY